VALRWLSLGVGTELSLLTRTGIAQLAFVATPPLFMVILLTTRPAGGLALRLPPWWSWPVALTLAALAVPPLAGLTLLIVRQFPALQELLTTNHPLTRELRALAAGESNLPVAGYFLVLVVLPAVCEELAFRGFILTGLRRGFRPWTAILLSAFLFSLYQMNVFQFVPHFVLGIVLGLLAVRTNSVLPPMLFHLVYNALLLSPVLLGWTRQGEGRSGVWELALAVGCALAGAAVLFALWRRADEGQALEERQVGNLPHEETGGAP
jgi:sodium transport system permease protein